MLEQIWFSFLYQPVFNALIWIYNTMADQNLGWSIIWLTVLLRLLLLPFSLVTERNKVKQERLEEMAIEAASVFKNDHVAQKEEYRRVMKKNKITPWAKVVSLGVQILVLVLLYQVFMQGITGEKVIRVLYGFVDFPGKINTNFFGFNIGAVHGIFWPFVVGVYLFMSIFIEHRGRKMWDKSEVVFLFLFPLFSYVVLWYLPMVKSLFILTSMVFSDIISLLRKAFYRPKDEA